MKYMSTTKVLSEDRIHRIALNDRVGIGISKTMASFAIEDGGYENLTFSQQDTRNVLRKSRLVFDSGDAKGIKEYFLCM